MSTSRGRHAFAAAVPGISRLDWGRESMAPDLLCGLRRREEFSTQVSDAHPLIPQADVNPVHFDFIQYLLYPLKVTTSGAGRDSEPPINGAVGLMVGAPPFTPSQEALPCGLFAVDLRKPFVMEVGSSRRLERNAAGEAFAKLGSEAVTVEFWAPRAGEGTLSFDCGTDPSLPEALTGRVWASEENGQELEAAVEVGPGTLVSLPITARAGVNLLKRRCGDGLGQPRKGAPRPTLLYVMHLRFAYSGGTP